MTPNKIIFSIIGGIILVGILYIAINLNASGNTAKTQNVNTDFTLWVYDEEAQKMRELIAKFQEIAPEYAEVPVVVESFDDAFGYKEALNAAFMSGNTPDIFSLSSSENSIYENYTLPLWGDVLSANDFRLRFFPIFGEELIVQNPNDVNQEYIRGIPYGFQTLALYYNRKYFLKPSELETWSDLALEIKNIHEKQTDIVPLALGNGSGVSRVGEIFTAFLVQKGVASLGALDEKILLEIVDLYQSFGDIEGDNRYNSLSAPLELAPDFNHFTEGNVSALFGTLKDLQKIDAIGYPKNFLFATHFPYDSLENKKTWIDYSYFTIASDTQNKEMAYAFMQFLGSAQGQKILREILPYALSPETSVAQELSEKKVNANYNIIYKNFLDPDATLTSFSLENPGMFHRGLKPLFDEEAGVANNIAKLSHWMVCSNTKAQTLMNLSSSCITQ